MPVRAPHDHEAFSRRGASVAALFLAMPFVMVAGGYGMALLAGAAGIVGASWAPAGAWRIGGPPLWLAIAFIAYVCISALWSPTPDWRQPASLIACTIAFTLLIYSAAPSRSADQALVRRAAVGGVIVAFALLGGEAAFDFPLERQMAPNEAKAGVVAEQLEASNAEPALAAERKPKTDASEAFVAAPARGIALAVVCLWGALAIMARWGWPGAVGATALLLLAFYGSAQFGAPANAVALLAGLLAALVGLWRPRATVSILAQALALWIVVAPWALAPAAQGLAELAHARFNIEIPVDALARIQTWGYAAHEAAARPFFGWGLGASQSFDAVYSLSGWTFPYIPSHPHNVALQVWLETGGVGAGLAAMALGSFGRRMGAALAQDRWAASAACGALASAGVIANSSFGAWQPWWWATIAAAAALVRAAQKST